MRHIALVLAVVLGGSLDASAQIFTTPLNQVEIDQQVSTAGTSSVTLNSPNKSLASLTVFDSAAGFALVYDAASLPANGAVAACAGPATARPCLMWCAPIAAGGFVDRQWRSPMSFTTGIVVAVSSTGCATLTAATTGQIFAQAP
jgi:hypothetical protein